MRHYTDRPRCYILSAENDRTAYLVDSDTGYHTHLGTFDEVSGRPLTGPYTRKGGTYYVASGADPSRDLPGGL